MRSLKLYYRNNEHGCELFLGHEARWSDRSEVTIGYLQLTELSILIRILNALNCDDKFSHRELTLLRTNVGCQTKCKEPQRYI